MYAQIAIVDRIYFIKHLEKYNKIYQKGKKTVLPLPAKLYKRLMNPEATLDVTSHLTYQPKNTLKIMLSA